MKPLQSRNGAEPPHSIDAEKGVLGSMMTNPNHVMSIVRQALNSNFFYVPAHQIIFNAALELWDESGAADIISLGHHLETMGQLENVGGRLFVTVFTPSFRPMPLSIITSRLCEISELFAS